MCNVSQYRKPNLAQTKSLRCWLCLSTPPLFFLSSASKMPSICLAECQERFDQSPSSSFVHFRCSFPKIEIEPRRNKTRKVANREKRRNIGREEEKLQKGGGKKKRQEQIGFVKKVWGARADWRVASVQEEEMCYSYTYTLCEPNLAVI